MKVLHVAVAVSDSVLVTTVVVVVVVVAGTVLIEIEVSVVKDVKLRVRVVVEAVTVVVVVETWAPKQLQAELYRTAPEQAEAYAGIVLLAARLSRRVIVLVAVVVSISVDVVTTILVLVTVTEVVVEVIVVVLSVVETVAVGVVVTVIVVNKKELQSDFAITGRVAIWLEPVLLDDVTAGFILTSAGKGAKAVIRSASRSCTDFENSSRSHASQAYKGKKLHLEE
jgi:hypothetical protein